jgi:hypothetical protein
MGHPVPADWLDACQVPYIVTPLDSQMES